MITRIRKWGNSFGVRLTKKDLSDIPTFSETDEKVSEQHDKYLYGNASA